MGILGGKERRSVGRKGREHLDGPGSKPGTDGRQQQQQQQLRLGGPGTTVVLVQGAAVWPCIITTTQHSQLYLGHTIHVKKTVFLAMTPLLPTTWLNVGQWGDTSISGRGALLAKSRVLCQQPDYHLVHVARRPYAVQRRRVLRTLCCERTPDVDAL